MPDANPTGAIGWDADTLAPTESLDARNARRPVSPGALGLERLKLIRQCQACGRPATATRCPACAQ